MMLPDFKDYIPMCGCPVCWPPTIPGKFFPVGRDLFVRWF